MRGGVRLPGTISCIPCASCCMCSRTRCATFAQCSSGVNVCTRSRGGRGESASGTMLSAVGRDDNGNAEVEADGCDMSHVSCSSCKCSFSVDMNFSKLSAVFESKSPSVRGASSSSGWGAVSPRWSWMAEDEARTRAVSSSMYLEAAASTSPSVLERSAASCGVARASSCVCGFI